MKTYKLFGTPWHVSHNAALCSIPGIEWGLLKNNIRRWNWDARPFPKNAKWVSHYDPNEGYHAAVIHVDQQCVDPKIGKGQLYRDLNRVIQDIPKIVINHGTPWWPERWGQYGEGTWLVPPILKRRREVEAYQVDFLINGGTTTDSGELIEIEGMKKLVGDNVMVVNSHQAKEDWGWGHPIIHGLDPDEWFDLPKEPRPIITLSPAGLDSYYGRDLLQRTKEHLRERYGIILYQIGQEWIIGKDAKFERGERDGFTTYREFLGRSLVYVNCTQNSPMPRGRTEGFLSGCCVLTTPFQDADSFVNFDTAPIWRESEGTDDYIRAIDATIEEKIDEINGFLIPNNPVAIGALTNHLICNRYKEAVQIGQNGKQMAMKRFDKKRYDSEWRKVIKNVLHNNSNNNNN